MSIRGVIVQGSSRSKGNTYQISSFVQDNSGFDIVDLKSKQIGQFDYEFKNQNDDFIPLIREIVANYDIIIFVTPVYWYAMSGIMKVFFDRITDCLQLEKKIGRDLRGKATAMISCGSDQELKKGFNMPFVESANYLGMNYLGDVHCWIEDTEIPEKVKQDLIDFITTII
ncbi:FMN reductase [Aquimarina aggregata]|uniref:FMN reductase n=1 Tax=Aquimarina aggregata TaxID=1642818 RepID=A0A162CUN1_9FLAO|nr:NAD(P)H-dependent oxidoreductase [Aquimarina aggregata]KZS41319.1 FMN reductase [Aquimarina aggregata]